MPEVLSRPPAAGVVRFDRFRFDAANRRLLREDGAVVELEPKAIDLLRFLLDNPRRVVHRDELLDAVWKDVAVTPNALTRVIAQLRKGLDDDARDARVIETVPTIGYRFLPAVYAAQPVAAGRRRTTIGFAAAGLSLMVLLAGWNLMDRREVLDAPRAGLPVPITSDDALTLWPAVSPDGGRLAFASNRAGGRFRIYIRDLDGDAAADRAVSPPDEDYLQPAWSPDGQRIAFARRAGGILVIDLASGSVTRVADFGTAPAWSPDGRQIVFQSDFVLDPMGRLPQPGSTLWSVPSVGGEATQVTMEGAPPGGHGFPAWSADGARVFFVAARNVPVEVWSIRLDNGVLTQITEATTSHIVSLRVTRAGELLVPWRPDEDRANGSILKIQFTDDGAVDREGTRPLADGLLNVRQFSLAPDGRRLYVAQKTASGRLLDVPVDGTGSPLGPPRALPLPSTAIGASHPAFSDDGQWLAFSAWHRTERGGIWMMDLSDGSSRQVSASSGDDRYPAWVPGSRRLVHVRTFPLNQYLVETDIESGRSREVVRLPPATGFPVVASNGDTFVANLGNPLNTAVRGSLRDGYVGPWEPYRDFSFPRLSPDGRLVAFERREGSNMPLYVAAVGGMPRRLSTVPGQHWPYGWSPDSRHVAVASYRGGVWNIWTVDVSTGVERPVTAESDPTKVVWYPAWSPAGDRIVYSELRQRSNLSVIDLGSP